MAGYHSGVMAGKRRHVQVGFSVCRSWQVELPVQGRWQAQLC